MRPLDLYTEKQIRDGSPDKIAQNRMMREVNTVGLAGASGAMHAPLRHSLSSHDSHTRIDAMKQKDDPNARDKMAFMSIALCSPMMLLGMGAMMAGADELKMLQGDSEAVAKANRNENLRRAAAAEKAKEQSKKIEEMLQSEPPKLSLSMPAEKDWAKERESRIRKPIAQYGRSGGVQDHVARPRNDVSLKVSKLIKEKQALVDLMESLRGKAQLSEVSAILSRVEILDKSLKQLGC